MSALREVAASVAAAVATMAYHAGVATEMPQPQDIMAKVQSSAHDPTYRRYS